MKFDNNKIHSLLGRQLRRYFGSLDTVPKEILPFIDVVNSAYLEFDVDRGMLERSLDLSSNELLQANADMRATFNALPDLFFRLDVDGKILDYKAGPGAEAFLGQADIKAACVLGRSLAEVAPDGLGADLPVRIHKVVEHQARDDIEYELSVNGRQRHYELRLLPLLTRQVIALFRDISDRKLAEISIVRSDDRLRRQNEVLADLARSNVLGKSGWEQALSYLTESGARALEVDRVGIWFFGPGHETLRCVDLYEARSQAHSGGLTMTARDFPDYFQALAQDNIVATVDALSDPRTREFREVYLEPNGVGSLLDVPIRSAGQIIGVICHEHLGGPRDWALEEQGFARSMADLVALALETRERGRMKTALDESEEKFRILAETTESAIFVLREKLEYANPAAERLTGYGVDSLTNMRLREIVHPDFIDHLEQYVQQCLEGRETGAQFEIKLLTKSGIERWLYLTTGLIRFVGEQAVLINGFDITDRKEAEEQLRHEALHDSLTGLPNRTLFLDRLEHSIEISRRRSGYLFAVLFLDLDRFKLVNDSLGHGAGDSLLSEVGSRLQHRLRPGDTVARLGGDEFAMLLEDITGLDQAIDIAGRVQAGLEEPLQINGSQVFSTGSIGVVMSDGRYETAEDMLRDADIAMYRAKVDGSTKTRVFDANMKVRVRELLSLETDLRQAMANNELQLFYQPIVRLESGQIDGFEALLRWEHSEKGMILPMEFVPLAEETGLIVPIGEWVIREACRQLSRLDQCAGGLPGMSININVSARQFEQADFVEKVKQIVFEENADSSRIVFELTETIVMKNPSFTAGVMGELKALGIRVHIDDFGTGYSSLSYLHRFPIDSLKIDRSFVTRIGHESDGAEVIRAIIALAHSLGVKVVAEGIETIGQFEMLRSIHCEKGQGYYFSRPLPVDAVLRYQAENFRG